MALALRSAALLRPEIRLAQVVSEFEAALDADQKAAFRNARVAARTAPPTSSDVMRLTAEIDSRVRQEHGPSRCFGPRLTNILQAVQQFAALGDTVLGGSQNLVACGVWSAVRMMLHMAIGYASYLEKLSLLFMTAGRHAPRYQALAIIYPQSKSLQGYLSEYFIVIVRVCQSIQQYAKKSAFGQFKSSLNDADVKEFQADLDLWGNSIRDEAALLLNQRIQNEAQENKKARTLTSWWSTSSMRRHALERRVRWLDACSTYDFQTTWKQTRKRGSTSLLTTWTEYQDWKQGATPSAILFSGKIGAGKSVTLANIVDDLYLAGDTIVVYFFCRHDLPESLKSRTILGSLARQYLSCLPEDDDAFKEDVLPLDLEKLAALMRPKPDGRSGYLLLDGFDECSTEERRSVLTQISWLQKHSSWRLGFSARFSAESFIEQHVSIKWQVSIPTSNPDIERYVNSELDSRLADGQLVVGDPGLVSEIRAALLGGANGMFLWVALQLDQICLEATDHSIRLAIKSLPRDLSETYARILSSSSARDTGRHHIRIFKFLVAAYVPLSIDQIQEMAGVTIGDTTWDPSKRINHILKIVGFCGSLVMIEEEEQTLRFIHHSARSFCQGDLGGSQNWRFCFNNDEAHREIGETAVTYLSYGIFDKRLSTRVIPKVNVGEIPGRIIQNTFDTSFPIARLAFSFVMPKQQESNRDIGQFLAQYQPGSTTRGPEAVGHSFFPYAEKFWMLHTRSIENSVVHGLCRRLFDQVDVLHLQLTPHVLGPLDTFGFLPYKHPLVPAFLWAVNYSHVAMFDHLMERSGEYPFSTKLPWARMRFFRSLLQHLRPYDRTSIAPRLWPLMVQRLLPLAVVLRVYHAVEWMLPYVDSKETIRALEVAVSCGNYQSAAFISSAKTFNPDHRVVLPNELLATAACSEDVRLISLMAKMGAARFPNINASALERVLRSDKHQASLLRMIFILAKAGVWLLALTVHDICATFQLLAISPELNPVMASQAIARLLTTASNFPGLHRSIFRRACSIGSFELATATSLSYEAHKAGANQASNYPLDGDEMDLVLQTISSSRIRLASWLIGKEPHVTDSRAFCRVILMRNWQLANELLTKKGFARDALRFCEEHELLHSCLLEGDLEGVEFQLKIGMKFDNPMLEIQTLVTQDPEYFTNISIAELLTRNVFSRDFLSPGFTALNRAMERLVSSDNPATWDPKIHQLVLGQIVGGRLPSLVVFKR
ncbi:hypothetical protein QIS74_04258 [Colletotrichum tabaci]|uniref:Nephrocystin 3-like N-terminal domain-containing protein n=1 Tax=Colletotrichum tabaci TaxID=1209068 RepID=A0AAV9TMI0_9PEZI